MRNNILFQYILNRQWLTQGNQGMFHIQHLLLNISKNIQNAFPSYFEIYNKLLTRVVIV
jgi:hypothetical protein